MAYAAMNDQTGARTGTSYDLNVVLDMARGKGWEDCETVLMEWEISNDLQLHLIPAEFPCTYQFHYGEEHYTCELTSNRPDSYCEVHSA